MDVKLSESDVLQPDILFIEKDRRNIIAKQCIEGAPDLVVEILSPTTAERDQHVKKQIYAKHGVNELWNVSPEGKTVEIFVPGNNESFTRHAVIPEGERIDSPLLPEFNPGTSTFFRFP